MVSEYTIHYQRPILNGTGDQSSDQKPEPSQMRLSASRFLLMFMAAFLGSLSLFVFCVCKSVAEWFSAYQLQLFVCFCQFDGFRVDGGALCLVACRTILVSFVFVCLLLESLCVP